MLVLSLIMSSAGIWRYPFEWDEGANAFFSTRVPSQIGFPLHVLGSLSLSLSYSLFSLRMMAGFLSVLFLCSLFLLSEELFSGSGVFTVAVAAAHNLVPAMFFVFHTSQLWSLLCVMAVLHFLRGQHTLASVFFSVAICTDPFALTVPLSLLVWSHFNERREDAVRTVILSLAITSLLLLAFSIPFTELRDAFLFFPQLMARFKAVAFLFVLSVSAMASITVARKKLTREVSLVLWLCALPLLSFIAFASVQEHHLYFAASVFFILAGKFFSGLGQKISPALLVVVLLLSFAVDYRVSQASTLYHTGFDDSLSLSVAQDASFHASENLASPLVTDFPLALFLSRNKGAEIALISFANLRRGRVTQKELMALTDRPFLLHSRLYSIGALVSELYTNQTLAYEHDADGHFALFVPQERNFNQTSGELQ